jgi:hypothetical protein
MTSKYEVSNCFWECFFGEDADINRLGKVFLFPFLMPIYVLWLTLDFLFAKED